MFGDDDLSAQLARLERALQEGLSAFLDPWVLVQLAVIVAALLASAIIGKAAEEALEGRVRAVHGQPRLTRFLALLLRRTRWIVAALLLGAALLGMRAATLPSRSVIVGVATALIAAWVVISVLSRLIRNRVLARLVAWGAWIYVALLITGTSDEMAVGMDSLAIRFGTFRISSYDVLQAIVVVSVALWLASMLGGFLERRVARSPDLTPSVKVLVGKFLRILMVVVAGGVALAALGIDLTTLTVFSGALGVGIGFGLQKVVSNFVSGVIILLDKSIKPGDTISLGETFGWVRTLRSRFVSVMTRDGTEYLVPNEDFITQRVISWSHTDTLHRFDVNFGVAYDCDPHVIRRLAVESAKSVERVVARPQPVCHISEFAESSIDFILRFWIDDPQNGITNVRGDVLLALWDSFKEAGIQFPYPRRDVVLRSPIEVRAVDR